MMKWMLTSDNSDTLWICATETVSFTPPLDESDGTLDYDFQEDDNENDNVHPSADLYEIYERS